MKGLLLKDFYTVIKYCRAFFVIMLVFVVAACFENNSVFVIYPLIFTGLIPITLFSYDEREKWNITCETLPCTRAEYVSGKFLMGLSLEIAVLLLSAIAQVIRMSGTFNSSEYFSFIGIMFGVGIIVPTIVLPLLFRFGSEKGRIAYYIVIGTICAGSAVLFGLDIKLSNFVLSVPVICLAATALFALSWWLSVQLYNKREL